jgi:hypothetical protein
MWTEDLIWRSRNTKNQVAWLMQYVGLDHKEASFHHKTSLWTKCQMQVPIIQTTTSLSEKGGKKLQPPDYKRIPSYLSITILKPKQRRNKTNKQSFSTQTNLLFFSFFKQPCIPQRMAT